MEIIDAPPVTPKGSALPERLFFSARELLRSKIFPRWPEWTALLSYAALLAMAIPYHEPFADEAQAWQLARSLSLPALFRTYLRYEGSPGLWYFMLWIFNHARVSYAGMHWICGAIAFGAVALLVLYSPFPRYLKLALPFTYFLMFQYAIVARSYALVPILLFLIALWWKRSPLILALLLGLLANVALHAAAISGGLVTVYLVEQIRSRGAINPRRRWALLLGVLILLGFYAFALWTVWPSHDLAYMSVASRQSSPFLIHTIAMLVWAIYQPWVLSLLFWITILLCFYARRKLIFLIPVLFFSLFCGAVGCSTWWHAGLVVPLVVCLLWITWPAPGSNISRSESLGRAAMIAMACVHILWSAYALAFDHNNAYSPDLATAKFLQPLVRNGATIAVTYIDEPDSWSFDAVGLLPYFDHNIFANQTEAFYWWSKQNRSEERFNALFPSRPRILLVEMHSIMGRPIDLNHPRLKLFNESGYSITNVFCGSIPMRLGVGMTECHVILQYSGEAQGAAADTTGPVPPA